MAAQSLQRDRRLEETRFRPATDIIEMEDGFHIFMDLPGVSRETLSIDLNGAELSVTGRTAYKSTPMEHAGAKFAHMEFSGGEYYRAFTISDDVDRDSITASLSHGVLELFLPRSAKHAPRRIEVQAG